MAGPGCVDLEVGQRAEEVAGQGHGGEVTRKLLQAAAAAAHVFKHGTIEVASMLRCSGELAGWLVDVG